MWHGSFCYPSRLFSLLYFTFSILFCARRTCIQLPEIFWNLHKLDAEILLYIKWARLSVRGGEMLLTFEKCPPSARRVRKRERSSQNEEIKRGENGRASNQTFCDKLLFSGALKGICDFNFANFSNFRHFIGSFISLISNANVPFEFIFIEAKTLSD